MWNTPGLRKGRTERRKRMLFAIREPDAKAVCHVADKLNIDATKVASVWILMIDQIIAEND